MLDLDDIQGDVLLGLHKDVEALVFFRIADSAAFKRRLRRDVIGRITTTRTVQQRSRMLARHKREGRRARSRLPGLNLGFTKDGLTRLLGRARPRFEAAFERGAADPQTTAALADPPPARWLPGFAGGRIDGVFLLTAHDRSLLSFERAELLRRLGPSIAVVQVEEGAVRPGAERGREHFGFADGISQPGIRGLTRPSRPIGSPNQGFPGQALVWPGEFVLGQPRQSSDDPNKPGPVAGLPAPWAKNGSYMVFRRLEQRVPEFRAYVAAEAARLGLPMQLLMARMVGRWQSGAPVELTPIDDNPALGRDPMRNNDFAYRDDPFQRACPYAAHIRKANARDDIGDDLAATLNHRIIRQGIPFGPEVMPGESCTMHSRGLLFVCYQASIAEQFEFIQKRWASNPDFVSGKDRPDDGAPVHPGFDPIIGAAAPGEARFMDEPAPNFPSGNRRSRLDLPAPFVVATGAAYFFMPSLSALRNALS